MTEHDIPLLDAAGVSETTLWHRGGAATNERFGELELPVGLIHVWMVPSSYDLQ